MNGVVAKPLFLPLLGPKEIFFFYIRSENALMLQYDVLSLMSYSERWHTLNRIEDQNSTNS